MQIDPKLFDYVQTESEGRALKAIVETGSCLAADEALGQKRSYASAKLNQIKRRAATQGYAPGHVESGTAPGFGLKYIKVHRDEDGQVKQTWECQAPDQQNALEVLSAAVEALAENIKPVRPIAPPALTLSKLLTQYTFTDYHVNMLAWRMEGGADWDLKIAEETGMAAMQFLTSGSPASEVGVVLIQGDWQHYDSLQPMTPTSGHVVDGDSRPGKGIDVSLRLIETLVHLALQKHKRVILQICEGNHDLYTSLIFRKLFARLYRDEPRVEVPDSEKPFYAIKWGNTALFYHHGHLKKWDALPLTFAAMFPEIWGSTTKRYGNTGHYHHEKRQEFSGIKMIQHPTMAANDSHGSRHGYISEREMTAITFHSDFGRATEVVVTPEMIFEPGAAA